MCGIVGFSNRKKLFENEEYAIRKMSEKIAHRGETAEGYYNTEDVYLGHRRLSIRDIEKGTQPMSFSDENGNKYTIVYNGEIYNTEYLKQFLQSRGVVITTTSDTEILLKLYILLKEKCLEMLRGIFAFAIYSEPSGTIFLARDQLGVKPLFYTIIDSDIIFASDMKALLCLDEVPKVIDEEGIKELLGMGPVMPIGKNVFKGIKEVMPGNYVIFDRGNTLAVRYFKLKSYSFTDNVEWTAKKVHSLLSNSIRSQLVSDVKLRMSFIWWP